MNTITSSYQVAASGKIKADPQTYPRYNKLRQVLLVQSQKLSISEVSEHSFKQQTTSFFDSIKELFQGLSYHTITTSIAPELGQVLEKGTVYGAETCLLSLSNIGLSNIIACGDGVVGYFDKNTLSAIQNVDPTIGHTVRLNFAHNLLNHVRPSVPLFSDMSDVHVAILASKVEILSLMKDEIVFHQGDVGDKFYVIAHGYVHICVDFDTLDNTSDKDKSITEAALRGKELGPGQYFGEVALISGNSKRAATIKTSTETILIAISDELFRSVFMRSPQHLIDLKIKLAGTQIDLVNILLHPQGCLKLGSYLNQEVATESMLFWKEAYAFEMRCNELQSEYEDLIEDDVYDDDYDDNDNNDDVIIHSNREEMKSTDDNTDTNTTIDKAVPLYHQKRSSLYAGHTLLPTGVHTIRRKSNIDKSVASDNDKEQQLTPALLLAATMNHANEIIKRFITNGSPDQVNLPSKMQKDIETSARDLTYAINERLHNEDNQHQHYNHHYKINQIDFSFFVFRLSNLFLKAKTEVYDLIKNGPYQRFRLTDDFKAFIASFRPYK